MNYKQTENGVNTLSPYEKKREEILKQWSKLIASVSEELNKKYYLAIIKLALTKLGLESRIGVRPLANFYRRHFTNNCSDWLDDYFSEHYPEEKAPRKESILDSEEEMEALQDHLAEEYAGRIKLDLETQLENY